MTDPKQLHLAYVADGMADIRMIEGLGRRARVTLVAPGVLGERTTNFWPPRPPAVASRAILPGGRIVFVPRAMLWLLRHRRDIDVVFALDNLTAALAATAARTLGGPPVVLQIGRPTLDYLRCQPPGLRRTLRRLLAWLLVGLNERRADAIGAVSDYCATQCRQHNRLVRSVPWYGVDTDVFQPQADRAAARSQLGLPTEGPVVMLRSRIAPEKDPATFVRAVGRLRDSGRALTAVYMGGETEDMDAVAGDLGVEILSRRPSGVDEIPLWYVAADVDVQTSFAEGLGVSPLEALASGTPVIVSDVGGLPEVVDGGRVGALVPVGDDAALADAITRYLDDPDLAERHGREGRGWVRRRFGVEQAFDAWMALARDAIRPERVEGSAPMRVLFVDHETRLSGGQRDLVDLVRALDASRFEIHVALPGRGPLAEALEAHGVTVHEVDMSDGLRKVSRWELAARPWVAGAVLADIARSSVALSRLAGRLQPDVIHSNSMKSHLLAVPAARTCGAPLVWHIRDILQPGWLQSAVVGAASLSASRIVALSDVAAAPFRRGRLAERVRVVHNGVRPNPHEVEDAQAWRSALVADEGTVLVALVGQIAAWKGQDVFIEAAALAVQDRPELMFAIVGECLFPENEGDFDRRIRARVRELGLTDRVVFTGPVAAVEPVMAAADVVVHCSRLPEPFGRVIVEAMAQGTPVISTTVGAGPELVPPQAGRLVPPGEPTALASAIIELAGDPALRDALGMEAKRVAGRFDIKATGAGVEAVWDELVR